MTTILVEHWSFKVRTFCSVFFVFRCLAPTHRQSSIQIRSPLFVKGFECKTMGLTFKNLMILIVLHFINNYYENKTSRNSYLTSTLRTIFETLNISTLAEIFNNLISFQTGEFQCFWKRVSRLKAIILNTTIVFMLQLT